jgi:hypothetical protein
LFFPLLKKEEQNRKTHKRKGWEILQGMWKKKRYRKRRGGGGNDTNKMRMMRKEP